MHFGFRIAHNWKRVSISSKEPRFYNLHSRNCTAASRFSPTRFIHPSFLRRSFQSLIASRLQGMKRYTLGRLNQKRVNAMGERSKAPRSTMGCLAMGGVFNRVLRNTSYFEDAVA